jgi:MFS family permease
MMKQAALWITILQLPVYIAQKDAGGLAWDQSTKGIILFIWVLFQNIASVLFGAYSDKIGRKKSLFLSHFIMIIGYLIISISSNFFPFLLGVVTLGIGSGIFKPILEGSIAGELNKENSSLGWSYYIIAVNIGVIWSTLLIEPLRNEGWSFVFLGSSVILLIDLFVMLFVKDSKDKYHSENALHNIRSAFKRKELWHIVIIMSGFTAVYMQFYEMLPNFFLDWTDTRKIADFLPDYFSFERGQERYLSYEWIFWLNPILVVLTIIPITNFFKKLPPTKSLQYGMMLVTIGFALTGMSNIGAILLSGVVIYTFGEMIVRPKFFEYAANLADDSQKSLYMSFVNLSYAIGYMFSAITGGFIYEYFGEKSNFSLIKLNDYTISQTKAFAKFQTNNSLSFSEASSNLWNEFNPWLAWVPFIVISIFSLIFLVKYHKKLNPTD